jgi:hypothetical protein
MIAQEANGIRIEQVLHGYQGGHRRIAGSIDLDDASASVMLVLSDLLTNSLGSSNSYYLTGYPLRSAHRYVLARTWPAHEIARPGCVWTHSLVLDYEALAKLSDPHKLLKFFTRPHLPEFARFNVPLSADAATFDNGAEASRTERLDIERAAIALGVLYGNASEREVVLPRADPDGDEALALAIWRQMWPRLRRSFLFATCVSGPIPSIDADFYLLISPEQSDDSNTWQGLNSYRSTVGLEILLRDLPHTRRTYLRQFLSRYTSDAQEQRRAAAPLAEIYSGLAAARDRDALDAVAFNLRASLCDDDDCRLLKTDFLFGRLHSASKGVDQVDAFVAMLRAFHDSPNFADPELLASHLADVYRRKESALPRILNFASQSNSGELGDRVIVAAASALPLVDVASVSCSTSIKIRLALANRRLLGRPEFWPSSSEDRAKILSDMPWKQEDLPDLVEGLLPRMTGDEIRQLIVHEGAVAATAIVNKLAHIEEVPASAADSIAELLRFPDELRAALVDAGPLPLWLISRLAEHIEISNQERLVPWQTWTEVISRANWDDRLTTQYALASLLFRAALSAPAKAAFVLFPVSFDALHRAAASGRLPARIRARMDNSLPFIGYFNDWDFCAKLRTAVAEKYFELKSAFSSILYVTSDTDVLAAILQAIARTNRGRAMLEELLEKERTEAGSEAERVDLGKVRLVKEVIANSRSSWW